MNNIHIIFAGDSFSYHHSDTLNIYDKSVIEDANNTLKPHHFFSFDLINQNINNYTIHTLARPSFGNHVITEKVNNKINELKQNPLNKIYTIIQLSAFVRYGIIDTLKGDNINQENYPYDYILNTNIMDIKDIFIKHFNNIKNIYNTCIENNITNYIYFGWANIFTSDIIEHNLYEEIKELKQIVNFYTYDEIYDEINFYCAGKKPSIKKQYITNVSGDIYGGLTEYTRQKLPVGKRYISFTDPHPSSLANYTFYTDILKPWLIQNNLIKNIPLTKEIINTFQHKL